MVLDINTIIAVMMAIQTLIAIHGWVKNNY